eukprot:scaffold2910_cov390-Prasinococcus_capsulatus_cf.AAC.10
MAYGSRITSIEVSDHSIAEDHVGQREPSGGVVAQHRKHASQLAVGINIALAWHALICKEPSQHRAHCSTHQGLGFGPPPPVPW